MTEEIENEELNDEFDVEVKIIRLITGKDIIGFCFTNPNADVIDINSPMELILSRDDDSDQNIFLRPWLPVEIMSYNACTIHSSDILTIFYPRRDFVDYYYRLSKKMQEMIDSQNEEVEESTAAEPQATTEAEEQQISIDRKKLH